MQLNERLSNAQEMPSPEGHCALLSDSCHLLPLQAGKFILRGGTGYRRHGEICRSPTHQMRESVSARMDLFAQELMRNMRLQCDFIVVAREVTYRSIPRRDGW